jgi:hypothetical protein
MLCYVMGMGMVCYGYGMVWYGYGIIIFIIVL